MKHTHAVALSIALVGNTLLAWNAAAASTSCEELITTCFVSAPEERDECIQTASTSSACETSTIYALVTKRAQFATIKQIPHEGPAFLGPLIVDQRLVDQRCLTQFDTTWSAALVNGSISRESIISLSAALDECAQVEVPTLPHL